ncbi:MAG: thymidine kinase [Bacteriovoracaceae bacterium]
MHLLLQGSLEVICGPMFSGKTEELIRRVRRAQIARQKIQVFKPMIDNRYDKEKIVSHSSLSIDSHPVNNPLEILTKLLDSTRVIAIDEVQFFDQQIVKVILKLVRRGHRVIVAGLDLDYLGKPFGHMPELLALADEVTKVAAVCTVCGNKASKTQRLYLDDGLLSTQEQILINPIR